MEFMSMRLQAAFAAAAMAWAASEAAAQIVMNRPAGLVAFSPATPPVVFATVGAGLFRSTGSQFDLLGLDFQNIHLLPAGTLQPLITRMLFDPGNPQIVYASTEAAEGGVWKSVDGGLTWARANQGLPTEGGFVVGLQFEPGQPATLYCAIAGGVYKTTDGGAAWTKIGALPASSPIFLISPHNRQLWLCAEANRVRRSLNGGVTWLAGSTLPLAPGTTVTDIVADISHPVYIYVTAAGTGSGFGVYRLDDELSNYVAVRVHPVQAVRIGYDSATRKALLVTSAGNACLDRSVDQGFRWARTCANTGPGPSIVSVNPANPDQMYMATGSGLYRSKDWGITWNPSFGNAKPTIGAPSRPYEFNLPAGQSGSLDLTVQLLESQLWSVPFELTTSGGSWLRAGATGGSTLARTTVQVSTAGLTPGPYDGSIIVRSTQSANPTLTIPVKLTVTAAAADPGYTIQTVAGTGAPANVGEDGPAVRATLSSPDSLALAPDGSLYVTDTGNHSVKAVRPDGRLQRVAGVGRAGFTGDGGDPLLAAFQQPRGLALTPSGMYVSDTGNRRVRKIEASTVTTIVAGPENLRGLAYGPGEILYIALPTEHLVISVDQNEVVKVVAGTGVPGFRGDGGSATAARLSSPTDIFVAPNGDLYIADTDNHRIRVVSAANKTIRTIAGSGLAGFQGEQGVATSVALNQPLGVATDAAGNTYIADTGNNRIRMVTPDGQIRTIAGTGQAGFSGENSPAIQAMLRGPADIAVSPDGRVYFTDTQNHRIRKLTPRNAGTPAIGDGGIGSAAHVAIGLAPGGLFTIYGASLSPSSEAAASAPLPEEMAGTKVTINGRAVPLTFVSPGQINAQVPFETEPGEVDVAVISNGVEAPARRVSVQATAPGIFQYGVNRAVVQNANYSINAANNPARAGEAITIYLTGIGALDNAVATGAAAPGEPLSRATAGVTVKIGGIEAQVLFVGLTPGFVGLAQANVIVPPLGAGEYPVEITIGGAAGNRPVITVRN